MNERGAPLAQPTPRHMERKFATALFADLVGSTALAEREDPEVVQSVVGRVFDRLAETATFYEGLLEKFMGDAMLAIFGIPRTHEDDAERAVRAAIEMQAELTALNRAFAAEGRPMLSMRIGVEAGEVLVDLGRVAGSRDRMLTGDAVNTAARLQAAAEPGHIVVGRSVYVATHDVIEYRELEPFDLKGKAEPVPAWRAIRIKAPTRGERPRLGLEARLVGRGEELAILEQTLRRVETKGRPALVTVVGPAGVGKSRLVAEFERSVDARPEIVYWRRGHCLAYGNTSYSAFADAVKAQCEIFEDDPVEIAAKKTDAAVVELFGDESIAPQIRALVGAGEAGGTSREELFDAWRRFLERLAARHPLVVVLDDLHWADAGLLDFVEHVADWAQGPIMIVALARGELFETRPTWGAGKRNAASIAVDRLSEAEGEEMLDDLLPGTIPRELKGAIVERSEGNPLYLEEIVRKLIDDGALRATEARWEAARPIGEVEVPRSVQGLIAARLDGLPDDEKAVLQDAAVIGRVFWLGAVAELAGRTAAEIREVAGRLRAKELVLPHEPSSFSDEPELSFRHNLIRDGAYDSLPKALRADKHAGVVRWAEARAGDRAEDVAELIATHLLEALRYLEELGEAGPRREALRGDAFRWTTVAGERTLALWLRSESTRWFREAERLADEIGVPAAERAELARVHLSASWGTDPVEETVRVARRAVELYEEIGDPVGVGWARSQLIIPLLQLGRDEDCEREGRAALITLEPLGERRELAEAQNMFGWYLWRRGRNAEAEPLLRRSVEMATGLQEHLVHAQAMLNLGTCLAQQSGRSAEALEITREAFRLAKSIGDFANLMRCYLNLSGQLGDLASDYRGAERLLRDGLELADRAGARPQMGWLAGNLADSLTRLGRLDEAEEQGRQALALAVEVGDEPLRGMRLAWLALALLSRGRIEESVAAYRESVPILEANPEPQSQVFIPWVAGLLALVNGANSEAADQLAMAIGRFRRFNIENNPEVFSDAVRAHLRAERVAGARAFRDLSAEGRSPAARANAALVEGLLAPDPVDASRILRDAVASLEALGLRVDAARAIVDLGRAMSRTGDDPLPVWERARSLLLECGAHGFLFEVEEVLSSNSR